MAKKPSLNDFGREKRAFSLASEASNPSENHCVLPKISSHIPSQNRFPAMLSPTSFHIPSKPFLFLSPSNPRNTKKPVFPHSINSQDDSFFQRQRSIDLTESIPKLKNGESCHSDNSRKFHFIEDLEGLKVIKKESHEEEKEPKLSEKSQFLPYISLCNKGALDKSMKTKNLAINSARTQIRRSLKKDNNVFLTNLETGSHHKKPHQKFILKTLIETDESPKEIYPSINKKKLVLNKFGFQNKNLPKTLKKNPFQRKITGIDLIKEENTQNQDKIQYAKINSLMEFAKKMSDIISSQKEKIDILLENVSEKFVSVMHIS